VSSEEDSIFREIADYTYDLESWIGPDGRTRWINPAVERITGYTVDECVVRDDYPFFLVHPDDRERIAIALEHARRHLPGNDVEFRIVRKDGEIRWGAVSWQDLCDREGRYRGYRTSVRDITSRKQSESELLASRDEAHRASQAKSEFLATMSHEIRTPIQNVLGYAQLLRRTPLLPVQARYLGILADQGEVLLRIVDDILDFTALQSVSIRMEQVPFELGECVASVLESARPAAEQKGLAIRLAGTSNEVWVIGDPHRLRQILSNLVSNAVKFTDTGGVEVRVEASPVVASPDQVALQIAVEDSGVGMTREQIADLFQPFTQADASISRRYGGSGLGLNICKRLVELMAGEIAIDSEPGKGSVVTLQLVLPRGTGVRAEPIRDSSSSKQADLPVLDILVVDDTAVARQMTVELLEAVGQVTHAVSNGNAALAALRAFPFDLVLMDKRMPDLDGLQLTRIVRGDSSIRQPYIAAVTANVLQSSRQACLDAGMDAFLGKPVRIADLERVVRDADARGTASSEPKRDQTLASWFDPLVLRPLLVVNASGTSVLQRQLPTIESELCGDEAFFRTRLEEDRFDDVIPRAHAVRGSLLAIGATRAAELALALEDAAPHARWTCTLALCLALARTRKLLPGVTR
jgi:PAS domain S-box-containing protein